MRIAERRECDVLVCGEGTAGLGGARSCCDNELFVLGGIPREVIARLDCIRCPALDDNPPVTPADGRVGFHPHKENPPLPHPVPLRALLVKAISNLMLAGRCLSATHEAHGSTRVNGTAMATGEACGTLAALAVKRATDLRSVPYPDLRMQLFRQGVPLAL